MNDHTTHDFTTKLCECGCGQPAPIAKRTNAKLGHIKGRPVRFIVGHHNKVRPLRPAVDRFWEKVIKRGPDECWSWTGSHDQHGYGHLRIAGKNIKAHRFSYSLHNGPIQEGADICHHCDHPPCVNPAHLFAGTEKDNIRDAIEKGRHVPPPRNDVAGHRNGHAIFTEEQVIEFRRHFAQLGISVAKFAKMHNVKYITMYQIIRYASWRHI